MTSEIPNLHIKNLNISKTKQDIEKLKARMEMLFCCV